MSEAEKLKGNPPKSLFLFSVMEAFSFELFLSSGVEMGVGRVSKRCLLDIQSAYPKIAQYHSSLKSQLTQFCLQKKLL